MAAGRRGVMGRRRRGEARETGVTATARRGVGGGFILVARVAMLITWIVVGIIVAGILLRVLAANADNSLVSTVHDVGKALVGPFKDLFTIDNPKVSIAVNWGLAALAYLIVGSLIARILRRAGVKSHPDRVG
jgi:energy-converting hydrogenase Eha subunit E